MNRMAVSVDMGEEERNLNGKVLAGNRSAEKDRSFGVVRVAERFVNRVPQ
jgi:hypothetical protein